MEEDEAEAEAEEEEGVDEEVAPPALVNGDVGEGTGEGYAKYELSADGDRAQIAVQEDIQRVIRGAIRDKTTHLQGSDSSL